MSWLIIRTLVRKDLTLFFRNRFFAFITILGMVAYIGMYFAMPNSVDESFEFGLYSDAMPAPLLAVLDAEDVGYQVMDSEAALQTAVIDGDLPAGIVVPGDLVAQMVAGQKPRVDLYLASSSPVELRDAYVAVIEGLAFAVSGQPLNIEANEVTLGPDMAGQQIPPRDRMRPLIAIFVIIMETMGLASLIAEEVQAGTLRAILITPMGVRDLFVGKGITGVTMTFIQAALVMGLTGGLHKEPLLILTALLCGALMATAIGFLMASASRDMMSTIGWGVLAVVILSVPAFGVLFPGAVSGWAKAVPSYYLVDTIHRVANFTAGWRDIWPNLLILTGMNVVLFGAGIVALRRKFS